MTTAETDIVIVGAGPVGLMCAHLAQLCGLRTIVLDQSDAPLRVGRADALNARTLQLLELAGLFGALYPLGKTCNTSSVWSDGRFISRESAWWDELEGCLHKHFLMIGQSYIEQLIDQRLTARGSGVRRSSPVESVRLRDDTCVTRLRTGEELRSHYVIGADGARSLVRELFAVPFEIVRPQLTWAVVDGVIETDFPKVPEIIVFQNETSDVAWIPREGEIDRFYVRMDRQDFGFDDVLAKINRALCPHTLTFKDITWSSRFSVKESVAAHFSIENRVFLAGDACHIHSVNGGQGLNTGLGDAFNLIWKLHMAINFGATSDLLQTYEEERKPVALSVVETSGELVRSTKFSAHGTHAQDYLAIVRKRAGNITGMGIRYGEGGAKGSRLYDAPINHAQTTTRLYALLDYRHYTLLIFGKAPALLPVPAFVKVVEITVGQATDRFWSHHSTYAGQAVLVRPDSYIASATPIGDIDFIKV